MDCSLCPWTVVCVSTDYGLFVHRVWSVSMDYGLCVDYGLFVHGLQSVSMDCGLCVYRLWFVSPLTVVCVYIDYGVALHLLFV